MAVCNQPDLLSHVLDSIIGIGYLCLELLTTLVFGR